MPDASFVLLWGNQDAQNLADMIQVRHWYGNRKYGWIMSGIVWTV